MPRRREFDEDEALEKAMHLFWKKGYADTSVRDLVAHTGVAHAGLYKAFGDKEHLFEAAVRKYAVQQQRAMYAPMEAKSAGRGEIETFFNSVIQIARGGGFNYGCFVANTAVAFGSDPGPVGELVRDNLRRHVKAFRNALKGAQKRGEIGPDIDVNRTATALAATFYGMSAIVQAGASLNMIEQAAKNALKQLG